MNKFTNPVEWLQSLDPAQLQLLVDASLEAEAAVERDDAIDVVQSRYPHLETLAMIISSQAAPATFGELDQEKQDLIRTGTIYALGILCRKAEIDSMPSLED